MRTNLNFGRSLPASRLSRQLQNPSLSLFPVRRIYGAPLALAMLTAVGLVAALLADGFWDGVSWIALSAIVAVIVWFVLRPAGGHVPPRCK